MRNKINFFISKRFYIFIEIVGTDIMSSPGIHNEEITGFWFWFNKVKT